MKIALVAPSPVPFVRGGAERAVAGLQDAINETTPHDAEVVKVPVDERNIARLVKGYQAFGKLDLSHFDLVISMKYPAWMLQHPQHTVLMFHPLRGLYDTYHYFGQPTHRAPLTREVGDLRALMSHWTDRQAADEFYERFAAVVDQLGLDHPDLIYPGPFTREVVHWLDRIALGGANRHLALSRTVAKRPDYFPPGISPGVVHLPGDLGPAPDPPRDRSYFFTASRLDGPKRIHLLIDAYAHVPGDIPLRIAGTGPEDGPLRAKAAADPRIEFLGFVSDDELREHYANAIAVPFVPDDEDLGLVTLEAFSQGAPVITCTDSGGPTEFVADGVTGLVAEPRPIPLGRALTRLAQNREFAADLGEAARRRGARVTWRRAAADLVDTTDTASASGSDQPQAPALAPNASSVAPVHPTAQPHSGPAPVTRRPERPKVVVTSTFRIDVPRHGGQLRCRHLYGELTRTCDVEVVALVDYGQPTTLTQVAPGLMQRTVPRSAAHNQIAHERTMAVGMPVTDIVAGTHIADTPQYIDTLLQATRDADLVLLAEPYLLPAVDYAQIDLPRVYDAFNVEADLKAEALPDSRMGHEMLAEVLAVEGRAVRTCQAVTACSETDAAALAARYDRSLDVFTVIPNGTDIPSSVVSAEERHRLGRRWLDRYARAGSLGQRPEHLAVFFGSWHPPNLDAARLLIDIAGELPEVLIVSAGSHGEAFLERRLPPNMVFPGVVGSRAKDRLLDAADLALNPMRTGSGTNLKLIEYLASGIPVVSTPFGARGVDVVDGRDLLLAEPDRFGAAIRAALADPDGATARSHAGRALAEASYSWSSLAHRLHVVIRDLIAAPARQ